MIGSRQCPPASIVLGVVLLPSLVLLNPAFAQQKDHYTITGDNVAVYNLIGEAQIVAGTGPNVEVDVRWGGEDAKEIKVETGPFKDQETVRFIYPGDRFVYPKMHPDSSTQMTVNGDGTFSGAWLNGRKVRISGRGSGLVAWADLTIRVPAGKSLTLKVGVGEVNASGVSANLNLDTSASPVTAEDIRGALNIDVGSGAVHVRNLEGDLNVDTGSGNVTLQKIRGTNLSVDTGSGRVTGSEIAAADIDVDTGSGGIEITAVETKRAHLETGSGGVDLDLLSDVEDVSIDTGSGGVRIGVPESLGAEVTVETGSGGIDIDVPHESIRDRRDYFRGRIGDGNGRITVETGSGGVEFTES